MTIEPRIAAAGPAYYDSPGDLPPGTKASLKMRLADDAWSAKPLAERRWK